MGQRTRPTPVRFCDLAGVTQVILMSVTSLRRDFVTRPIFQWAKGAMPSLSPTERDAIEAGDVWWDAELFTGNPDWAVLLNTPPARLSAEEQAFLDGPVNDFCAMLDDWKINWELRDLPPEAWAYLKDKRFFGMIIPKKYGGLGFSNFAHSEVIRKISTRSVVAAVTAMVPNSLGPGELMVRFGTKAQQDYWLPRLADGREIPAFGLTSPEAGSDAASMIDHGVVIRGEDGELAIKLNWHKRYITLGPVCTVLGLAFKLFDPGSPPRRSGGDRHHLRPRAPPTSTAWRSVAGICPPCRYSRTVRTPAMTSSSPWITSSAASSGWGRGGRC